MLQPTRLMNATAYYTGVWYSLLHLSMLQPTTLMYGTAFYTGVCYKPTTLM